MATALRWTYLVLGAAATFLTLVWWYWPAGHDGVDVTRHPIGRDFINNWAAPQLAFGGRLPVLFDTAGYHKAIQQLFGYPIPFHNWGYPPFTLLFFWPLGKLPYFWALALWTLGLFAAFAFVATRFVDKAKRPWMVLMLALSPASLMNAVGGQNGFLTGALLLGGVLAMERRPLLGGALFGLLTWKPQLGLGLPLALVALRAWKTIAAACIVTALLIGASVAAFGIEPWRQYLGETSAYQLRLLQVFRGFFTTMMTSVLAEARVIGIPYPVAAVIQAAVSIPVALVSAWAVTRTGDVRRRAFVIASAAPLITPYAFNYDLTAVTACLIWRFLDAPPRQLSFKNLIFRAGWLIPIALMPLNQMGVGIAPAVLIAVFAVAVREAVGDYAVESDSRKWKPVAAAVTF
jgi:hypothetical protein